MATPGERFDRASGTEPYKPQSRALNPLDIVIADGWNVRDMNSTETREHINSIKLSIMTNGYDDTKPISVRYDRVSGVSTLVDGQCRLTACRELRKEGTEIWIPCVVTEGDEAQLTAASLSGNAGRPLTQWEIGEGCRRLLRFGWSTEKISASICKSKKFVTEAIALSNVSLEAKSMMASHQVSPARVLQETKKHGDKAAEVLREAVAAAPKPPEPPQDTLPGAPVRKPAPAKPLARSKAPSASDKALEMADQLARMVVDEDQSIDKVILFARKYLKLRNL